MGLLAILEENGNYSYFDGENNIVEIGDENALYCFLFKIHPSYVDEGNNLRALILTYKPSKTALYEGCTLRDKNGWTYEFDPESGMVLINGGDSKLGQLPFGKYIIDIHRNIKMEEERRCEEERQRNEERRKKVPSVVRVNDNPRKKRSCPTWIKAGVCILGSLVFIGGGYCLIKK